MQISVTDAKAQLAELVRRAEAGDEVILTRHGRPVVRLAVVGVTGDAVSRRAALAEARTAAARASGGPPAAASQDFLYGGDGLPG